MCNFSPNQILKTHLAFLFNAWCIDSFHNFAFFSLGALRYCKIGEKLNLGDKNFQQDNITLRPETCNLSKVTFWNESVLVAGRSLWLIKVFNGVQALQLKNESFSVLVCSHDLCHNNLAWCEEAKVLCFPQTCMHYVAAMNNRSLWSENMVLLQQKGSN